MITLIRPDNHQPGEVVGVERGYICLRTTCITPAVRWYSAAAIAEVNPVYTCAEPPPIQGCELPPPMHIFPMPDMYPQAVFLAAANYYIHTEAAKIDARAAAKSSRMIEKAADEQLPKAA